MNYVADTHSLVWYFTNDSRLGKKAFKAFESTIREGMILVPTVVLAEVMFISKKGRVPITFEQTVTRIEELDNFDIVPLYLDVLRIADKIEAELEMHDRLIVATASFYEVILLTKDERIIISRTVKTIW